MKTWVMADVVPKTTKYLTAGKWYEVTNGDWMIGCIADDEDDRIFILLIGCPHLSGGDWHVHKGDTPPDAKPSINQQLLEALEKAQQDINWMLNNRQFLNGDVFDYIDVAIAAAKGE